MTQKTKKPKPTATQKLAREKHKKIVTLEANFGGLKAGEVMLVATPMIVDAYIRKIPTGEYRTIRGMRGELARRHKCDGACPISTSIFVRMSAEAAIEQMENGASTDEVTPFWRIIDGSEKIAGRLNVDPDWIDHQRALEGIKPQIV